MRSPAQTYKSAAGKTSNPRELEASLLVQAAARLQTVRDAWDKNKLDEALTYNRKLWTIFLADVTDAKSPLPREVRQNLANLGIFVMNQTLATIADPRPDQLLPLIKINREIAAGLMNRA
jgi:flagellar biosynthesis activator protein FlaF